MVKKHYKNGLMLGVFLLAMFFLGRSIGAIVFGLHLQREMSIRETAGSALENTQALLSAENWGLGFGSEGTQPSGTASSDKLKEYNAYYVGDAGEKKIYLTFDCGYENGNTSQILDALKKHDAPATFFVVGHFLESAPEMVKRMVEEGHTVGNHTYHHYDMSKISDPAVFQKEMDDVRTLFQETTGTEMAMYYRPPQGKYSETNLQMAKDLGYSTFFWSLAYVDWNVDAQPSHEEAFSKLTGRNSIPRRYISAATSIIAALSLSTAVRCFSAAMRASSCFCDANPFRITVALKAPPA